MSTPHFDLHIGIDYSGRETPTSRTPALQVYAAFDTEQPRRILASLDRENLKKNWCRKEIAEWLIRQAQQNITFVAGSITASRFHSTTFSGTSSIRGRSFSMISANTGPPIKNTLTSISSEMLMKAHRIARDRTEISG